MSFQQGLSGLNASSKALDVVGNNIANASTVGYKTSEAHFADVYANSLSGSGAFQVGIGSMLAAVQQSFTQGNITSTNNPLDISINGGGFFQMKSENGDLTYTRNGQFHLDKAGYIINDARERLRGYAIDANGQILKNDVDLQLLMTQAQPRATDDPASGNIAAALNLDSREALPTVAVFNPTNPQSYNYSTSMSVYDTLGNPHTMSLYFQETAAGQWDVHATLDGALGVPAGPITTLTFNTSGVLTSPTLPVGLPTWNLANGAAPFGAAGAVDFTGTTQYGNVSSVDRLTQGGYAPGSLTGLSVGADGMILGSYSNGTSRSLGQVILASFPDVNGLISLGNNQWKQTSVSGDPRLSVPGTDNRGVLQSASIEESNVDLTAELVDMITQQRNYQANAQTIKTQDQIMQTLVNLR
jgi:flagellar hook protein FlgE